MASVDQLWLVDFGEVFPSEPAHHRPAVIVGPRRRSATASRRRLIHQLGRISAARRHAIDAVLATLLNL